MTPAEQAIADYRTAYEARMSKTLWGIFQSVEGFHIYYDHKRPALVVRLSELRAMTARLQGGSDE